MLEQLIHALHEAIGSGSAAGLLIGGVLLGVFVGVIPGLSGAVVLSIALAFVYKLNLQATLVLFLAVAAASFFSASIASILLNSPAHPEAFPVSLDGYPMTEKGEAARALGISASATALGGVIGGLVMVGMLQVIMPLTKFFHPPEYVAIVALAMFLVATQGQISTSKSLVSVGVGFLISSIGTSTVTGTPRFDFGSSYLLGGIPLGVFAIGIFAIPQMILFFGSAKNVMGSKSRGDDGVIEGAGVGGDTFALSRVGTQIFQGVLDVLHNWSVVIGGALVGVMGGIIPGIGGFTANYVSYGLTKQLSKDEEKFGTGIPKGVVAPEASSIAKEAGGLVPTLGLGIPHGTASALFLAALAIQDQQVGIGFVKSHMVISYEMVWIIVLAGIFGAIFGLLLIPILIKVTRTPGILIFPFIISVSVIGIYVMNVSSFYEWEMFVIAVVGLVFRRLKYSLPSLIMGLVLGNIVETNIYLTHTLYPGVSFLWQRPDASLIFALAILVLVINILRQRRTSRISKDKYKEALEERLSAADNSDGSHQVLDLIVSIVTAVVALAAVTYSLTHFSLGTGVLPESAGILAATGALWQIPRHTLRYLHHRRNCEVQSRYRVDLEEESSLPLVGASQRHSKLEVASGAYFKELAGRSVQGIDSGSRLLVATSRVPSISKLGSWLTSSDVFSPVIDESWCSNGQYSRELVAFVWVFFAIFSVLLFGFIAGIPLFCVVYGCLGTRRVISNWKFRLLFAVASAVVMGISVFILFQAVNVLEPRGFL